VTIFFVLCHSGQLIGLNLYTLHLAVDPVTFVWQAGNGKHVPFALIAAFQIAGLCPEILTFEINIKVSRHSFAMTTWHYLEICPIDV
jgi:hypothetical protein